MLQRASKGFTLIELMIVVAIIGLLAAIAIPAYQGYIKTSKITSVVEHLGSAVRIVKAESAKINAGAAGVSVITQLNLGNKKAIGNPDHDAFTLGGTAEPGQVAIDGLDAAGFPIPGEAVTITAEAVFGTDSTDYPIPLSVSFTPE